MKYLIFFYLLSISLTAQIRGVVKDSISGEPIPYVSIWLENKSIGTSSEENGYFLLNTPELEKLQFSCIGYKNKTVKINSDNTFYLIRDVIELNDLVLNVSKNTIRNKIGNSKFSKISHLQGSIPQIIAKKFNYDSISSITNFLSEIEIFTKSPIKDAILKIRILEFDTITNFPGKSLVDEQILVNIKKGKKTTIIDVSKYKIQLPKSGLVIGIENVIIEQNKYFKSHGDKIERVYHAPEVLLNYVEEENSFIFLNLRWFKRNKHLVEFGENKGKKMIIEPAINIILTN